MNTTQKTTVLVPAIIPVSGYLLRNGQVVPDDGKHGELIREALIMPDGRLEPAIEENLQRIVRCDDGEYGITMGSEHEIHGFKFIRVMFSTGYNEVLVNRLTKVNPA